MVTANIVILKAHLYLQCKIVCLYWHFIPS